MRRSPVIDILIVLLATIMTHAAVGRHGTILSPDSASYILPAENLIAGRGLLGDGNVVTYVDAIPGFPNRPAPDTARSPVVPLMIAAFLAAGRGLEGVIVFQYFLSFITAVALYAFIRRRLSRGIALAAALLFVCCPPVAGVANQIGSETLFTLMIVLVLALAHRACERSSAPAFAAAGMVLGLAVLVRPVALYFIVPLAALVLLTKKSVAFTIILIATSQVLPAGWMCRNLRATGVAIVNTLPAEALLSQWAAGIQATRNRSHFVRLTASQQSLGFRSALHRSQLPLFYQAMALARSEGADPAALNPAQKSVYERRLGLHIVRKHPVAMAELMFSAIIELQIFIPAAGLSPVGAPGYVVALMVIVVLIALVVAGLGIRDIFRRDPTLALMIAATIVYFTVGSAIPEATSRYTVVYLPWYGVALAAGLGRLIQPGSRALERPPQSRGE